ncbi:hypothetical protein QC826_14130 [Rugamonas sp. DEMB1]|nr:hypothetical protein [Rugamonas sp. DEMB1]WGG53143.1 hypothetical protein QC826_14130 [Rugamonas sp. DEMB1]
MRAFMAGAKKRKVLPPRPVGVLHGQVGGAQQRRRVGAVVGEQADADRGQRPHVGRAAGQRLAQPRQDGGGQRAGRRAGLDAGQQDDELVVGRPRHRGALAGQRLEQAGHLGQHLVAHLVAEVVVDVAEAVQVDEQRRQLLAADPGLLGRLRQPALQGDPVGQPGQRVEADAVVEQGLDALPLGRLAHAGDAVLQVAQQLAQQRQLGGVEAADGAVVQVERADHLVAAAQRHGDAGQQPARQRAAAPGGEQGVVGDVAGGQDAALDDGGAGGGAAAHVLAPAQLELVDIVAVAAAVRHRLDALLGVAAGVAYPGQAVVAGLDQRPAEGLQHRHLVDGAGQRRVAGAAQRHHALQHQQAGGLLVAHVLVVAGVDGQVVEGVDQLLELAGAVDLQALGQLAVGHVAGEGDALAQRAVDAAHHAEGQHQADAQRHQRRQQGQQRGLVAQPAQAPLAGQAGLGGVFAQRGDAPGQLRIGAGLVAEQADVLRLAAQRLGGHGGGQAHVFAHVAQRLEPRRTIDGARQQRRAGAQAELDDAVVALDKALQRGGKVLLAGGDRQYRQQHRRHQGGHADQQAGAQAQLLELLLELSECCHGAGLSSGGSCLTRRRTCAER